MLKLCSGCQESKNEGLFGTAYYKGEKRQLKSRCKKCETKLRNDRKRRNGYSPSDFRSFNREATKKRADRKAGAKTDRWICEDSRREDKRKGRNNDLTREFIAEMITRPCLYCGATDLRMTLDRIDNALGHLQSNVNPCCFRCNNIRKDMPYGAWTVLVPSIRILVQGGHFGSWNERKADTTGVAPALRLP